LADAAEVKLAQAVFTIGFPNLLQQGVAPKFTNGTISAISGARDDQRLFQISAPVQPGNSGGPLTDEQGDVIGVVNARLKPAAAPGHGDPAPQNVNYAVKINIAAAMLADAGLAGKLPPLPKGKLKLTKAAEKVQSATVLILSVGR
jgi:S1-C subfamily serine protease